MQSEENFSNEVRAWELVIPRGRRGGYYTSFQLENIVSKRKYFYYKR